MTGHSWLAWGLQSLRLKETQKVWPAKHYLASAKGSTETTLPNKTPVLSFVLCSAAHVLSAEVGRSLWSITNHLLRAEDSLLEKSMGWPEALSAVLGPDKSQHRLWLQGNKWNYSEEKYTSKSIHFSHFWTWMSSFYPGWQNSAQDTSQQSEKISGPDCRGRLWKKLKCSRMEGKNDGFESLKYCWSSWS